MLQAEIVALDAENLEAWGMYHQVFTRFAVDTQTAPLLVARYLSGRTDDEALALMTRFAILHDALHPARTVTHA